MKPCDGCKRKSFCVVVNFLKRHGDYGPWELDDYFRENFTNVFIVTVFSGKVNDIVLECNDYNPMKTEIDYSMLVKNPNDASDHKRDDGKCSVDKCGSCKGKCK